MDVAVEQQADDLTRGVDRRASGVAAGDVVVGRKIEGRRHVQLAARLAPAVGNAEWSRPGRAVECDRKLRERCHRLAVLDPALHRAVVEAQRESRVRIDIGAVGGVARPGNALGAELRRTFHFVLVVLADRARVGID